MVLSVLLIIYLLALSVSDIKTRKIPVILLRAGMVTVLFFLAVQNLVLLPPSELIGRVLTALLGAIPGLLLMILSFYSDKIGKGDGIVIMTVGLTENCTFSMVLICTACLGLAFFSGLLLCFHKVSGKTKMPYIPFVTGAYMLLKLSERSYFLL